jgi:Zn finger protein HypA/HybF involved in hydrogenase expression
MKSGICPKCQAKEVHVVDGNQTDVSVPLGTFSAGAFAKMYVCVKCGYIEFFIEDEKDLPKIADRWRKVN